MKERSYLSLSFSLSSYIIKKKVELCHDRQQCAVPLSVPYRGNRPSRQEQAATRTSREGWIR